MPPVEGAEGVGGGPSFFRRKGAESNPQPAPGLASGKAVGDFRLVALIGQGGMGQVWEAEQLSLGNRRVAVKFLRPEIVTERRLELFAREARAGGRLHHPGIVTVHGYGEAEGAPWIAMEFIPGAWTVRDFLDDLARSAEIPAGHDRHVAQFVAAIADAMQAAHDAGVIHRDLKPQNVLVTPDNQPKVTDFGFARITDELSLSMTGDIAGTYLYMSPEQVAARRMGIDHRTDVFSLGILLYELLALRRPFQGDTLHQVAAQILTKDPPDLRTLRSRIPRDLVVITNHTLEKDPDRRYASMRELANDLRRHLADQPILATPPTRADRAVKWIRRNPTRSTATVIATTAFSVISWLLVVNLHTNRALAAERTNLSDANQALQHKTAEALANAEQAREHGERADREAQAATRRAQEVLRLSALQKLDDLVAEADRLWPAQPAIIPAYEDWLARTRELLTELPAHEATLAELRTRGRRTTAVGAADGPAPATEAWIFDQPEDRWWHGQQEKLVSHLRALADERTGLLSSGISGEHGWGIERRLAFARALREGPEYAARERAWAKALPAIRETYPGLDLAPQVGFEPIGTDPTSGFWEFAHIATGEPAERGADHRLILKDTTGLVFVLVPGGTFEMGAQKTHPSSANYDPNAEILDEFPVHSVTLDPFFVSKYEMTQGQWLRFTGKEPSSYGPSTLVAHGVFSYLNPVEMVDWATCRSVLARMDLELPTEAQWEYAARGDTTTVWWTGDEVETLQGAANLADAFCKNNGGPNSWAYDEELDDGYTFHAPVGSFAPNLFGLYDVIGNVWEWCRDPYGSYAMPTRPGDGERLVRDSARRIYRGGGFGNNATYARSAQRVDPGPETSAPYIGVRPARRLKP